MSLEQRFEGKLRPGALRGKRMFCQWGQESASGDSEPEERGEHEGSAVRGARGLWRPWAVSPVGCGGRGLWRPAACGGASDPGPWGLIQLPMLCVDVPSGRMP